MITYIESALGLSSGSLSTELGVFLAFILVVCSFYAVIKVILSWLDGIF